MDAINKKYKIEMTPLTPVNIGAGAEKEWVKGTDYIEDKHKIYLLNIKKIAEAGIDINKLTVYYAKHDDKSIKELIGNKLSEVTDQVFDIPQNSGNNIKTIVKNQLTGRPIIPGSSLKGSIRSILYKYLRDNNKYGKESDFFGNIKEGEDFLRFIKISDAEFDSTLLLNSKIFNLYQSDGKWEGGWKHGSHETNATFNPTGFNTLYEVIDQQEISYCDLMISECGFETLNSAKNGETDLIRKKKDALDIGNLFAIINKHTREYIKKEIAFFNTFSNSETQEIIDGLEDILSEIEHCKNSCVLKMSAGAGFHSITGDWQFNDYYSEREQRLNRKADKNNKPKSRKIIIDKDYHLLMMGFVKLHFLSEAERIAINQKQLEKAKKFEEEAMKGINEKNEKKRIAEELNAEKLANKNKFKELMSKASSQYENEQYEDCQNLLIEAGGLYPNEAKYIELNKKVTDKIEEIKKDRHMKELNEELAQSDAKKYECSLSEKLKNIKKLPTAFTNVKKWMKVNNKSKLNDNERTELKETLKRIYTDLEAKDQKKFSDYKNWKELESYLPEDILKQWIDEIVKK